jgi:hypothetical protein
MFYLNKKGDIEGMSSKLIWLIVTLLLAYFLFLAIKKMRDYLV